MQKRHPNDCMGCKYFYGMTGGGSKLGPALPMCSYYIDTGRHRMDDFGSPRKHNEWVNVCDKYEARVQPREKTRFKPFSENGTKCAEAKRNHDKQINEVLEMKFRGICNCPACGSEAIGTKDSRDINGNRIRRKFCKSCNYSFKTVEIMLEDLDVFVDQEDDGK